MPEISTSIYMTAPAGRVWEVLTDPDRYGDWNAMHTGFPNVVPALAAGAKFREAVSLMGYPSQLAWTVVQFEPPRVWSMDGRGPMGVTMQQCYALSEKGGGTTLSAHVVFAGAAIGFMASRLEQATASVMSESLRHLAALVPDDPQTPDTNVEG